MQGLRGRGAGALVAMVSVTLMAAFGGPARGADGFGFDLVVNLTPRAAEALKLAREGVVVSAWYYADPKPGATNVNPVGLIDLAVEERELASFAGTLRVGGEGVDTMALGEIGGPVMVNVNVYSTRRSGPDNILDCDFFDGFLSRAAAAPVELRCGLFDEHLPTQAKS
jgi:hypothetical protein